MKVWGRQGAKAKLSFYLRSSTETCPQERRVMQAPAEWGPLGSAEGTLQKVPQFFCDSPLRSSLQPGVFPDGETMTRMRWHVESSIWWSVQCLQPQTNFSPVQARENLWEALWGLIFFIWACPIHTRAAHSVFPGNLEPNGIISQWLEWPYFRDVWVIFSIKDLLNGTYSQTTLAKIPWTSLFTFLRLGFLIWQMGE